MLRYIAFLLLIAGTLLLFAGQWIAFEIYANRKLSKINQNLATFLAGATSAESALKIPYPEESLFLIRKEEGGFITTGRGPLSLDGENYLSAAQGRVSVYTKSISLGEYLNALLEKPLALGISISGLVLFLTALAFLLRGQGLPPSSGQKVSLQEKELLVKLKAVRTALALGGVIPKESLEEAKGIIEDIIKRMEGKG
ncbi:MAG: hypothetical protein RMH93_03105 [Aquificaceae bacterium]|nr:hypothetical protein [Aquificaceae bacterium]MDW8032516.1 hypothetical protein [Aquificaceae bacterium]MDW8293799.1 hypothetical protein [Aquificaceae bacterium]